MNDVERRGQSCSAEPETYRARLNKECISKPKRMFCPPSLAILSVPSFALNKVFEKTNSGGTMLKRICMVLGVLFCMTGYAQAQSWSSILDSSRATDWSGVGTTITNRSTVCSTSACNTVNAGTVTTTSLNAALASATSGQVVTIPSGTFTISAGFLINVSNITLRGAGPLSTTLNFTGGDSCNGNGGDACVSPSSNAFYFGSTPVQPGGTNAATWSGGYAQGATSITVSSVGSS